MKKTLSLKIFLSFLLLTVQAVAVSLILMGAVTFAEISRNQLKLVTDLQIKLEILDREFTRADEPISTSPGTGTLSQLQIKIAEINRILILLKKETRRIAITIPFDNSDLVEGIGFFDKSRVALERSISGYNELGERTGEIFNLLKSKRIFTEQKAALINSITRDLINDCGRNQENLIAKTKFIAILIEPYLDDPDAKRYQQSIESIYFKKLELINDIDYLEKSSKNLNILAAATVAKSMSDSEQMQKTLFYVAIMISVFSVILTVLLWYLFNRVLSSFMNGLNESIANTRKGNYVYRVKPVTEPELNDALLHLQSLSFDLDHERHEREKTEKEKRAVEQQLLRAQRIESIGRFAGSMAHDFNNILAVITGAAAMAKRRAESADILKNIEIIQDSCKSASNLIRQILTFSKNQSGNKNILRINDSILAMEPMLQRLLGSSQTLHLSLSADDCSIYGDQYQLEQVIINLVVNARDAINEQGSITITSRILGTKEIAAQYSTILPKEKYSCLTVSDTGPGISDDLKDIIFEPYFTTKSNQGGTGLGLSIVYGIIKNHEGQIIVESAPGKGAHFHLLLPVVNRETSLPAQGEIEREVSLEGNEPVLLVDDNADIVRIMQESLATYGYRVNTCGSGHDALEILKSGNVPKIIVTDIMMPGMTGIELAEHVSRDFPGLPVIAITGHAENELHRRAEAMNIPVLFKPVEPETVSRQIRLILDEPRNG